MSGRGGVTGAACIGAPSVERSAIMRQTGGGGASTAVRRRPPVYLELETRAETDRTRALVREDAAEVRVLLLEADLGVIVVGADAAQVEQVERVCEHHEPVSGDMEAVVAV